MEKISDFKIICRDKFILNCNHYKNIDPKGVLIIVHGAYEHSGRYDDFAIWVCEHGYDVVTFDLRGHGLSIDEKYQRGYMDSVEVMREDIKEVYDYVKYFYPDSPIYMFGHSMGSMFARIYAFKYDYTLTGLMLSGTVCPNAGGFIMSAFSRAVSKIDGDYGTAKILNILPDNRDWISYNKQNIINTKNDKRQLTHFVNKGNQILFDAVAWITKPAISTAINEELPILSLTGKEDFITGFRRGLEKTVSLLKLRGYKNVTCVVFRKMKHEIIHEERRDKVYNIVLKFMNKYAD